jgi:hypothetical protein
MVPKTKSFASPLSRWQGFFKRIKRVFFQMGKDKNKDREKMKEILWRL